MKKTWATLGLMAGMFAAGSAFAQVDVTGDVGTTGIGVHGSFPLRPDLNLRLGMGYLGYSYSGSTRDLDYDLKLKSNTYDALVDWFPKQDSAFRLTAGLAYNGNKIEAKARSNAAGTYTIGGNTYNAADVGMVEGKVGFNKLAPYLGIGWGRPTPKDKGWTFSTDVGVLFHGSPKTSLTSSGCTASTAVCSQFASDVARENAALRDEVSRLKVYPVLRVGVSYRF